MNQPHEPPPGSTPAAESWPKGSRRLNRETGTATVGAGGRPLWVGNYWRFGRLARPYLLSRMGPRRTGDRAEAIVRWTTILTPDDIAERTLPLPAAYPAARFRCWYVASTQGRVGG